MRSVKNWLSSPNVSFGERIEFSFDYFGWLQSARVKVDLVSAKGNNLSVNLNRIDSPIDFNLKTVTFRGSLEIPRNTKN